jgi:hypothetical protein
MATANTNNMRSYPALYDGSNWPEVRAAVLNFLEQKIYPCCMALIALRPIWVLQR